MNLDNFVVRPKRRLVERYADPTPGTGSPRRRCDEIGERRRRAAHRSCEDDDEEAKRFDLLVLRLQLGAAAAPSPASSGCASRCRRSPGAAGADAAIPMVREQHAAARGGAGDEWWQDVTLPMLELVRRRLRGLVRLIEQAQAQARLHRLQDELGETAGLAPGITDRHGLRAVPRQGARPTCARTRTTWRSRSCAATSSSRRPTWTSWSGCSWPSGGGTEDIERAPLVRGARALRALAGRAGPRGGQRGVRRVPGRHVPSPRTRSVRRPDRRPPHRARRDEARAALRIAVHRHRRADPESIFPSADLDRLVTILNSVRDTAAPATEVA